MGQLVLLRHGQSQWNLENKFTGWTDVDLSEKGVEEARHAGEALKANGYRFDRAFCSVLLRAKRTMDIVLEVLGQTDIPKVYDEALNERHYGDLQGLDKAETSEKFGPEQVHAWRRSFDVRPPGGESLEDTIARAQPYFAERILPRAIEGDTVLVSAHGNSLRGLVMNLENVSERDIPALEIPTGVPLAYEIEAENRSRRIGYLEPDGPAG